MAQFSRSSPGLLATAIPATTESTVRVARWMRKITRATAADSVIPSRFRSAKMPSSPTVAQMTLSPI